MTEPDPDLDQWPAIMPTQGVGGGERQRAARFLEFSGIEARQEPATAD